jgi:hypothetical protein
MRVRLLGLGLKQDITMLKQEYMRGGGTRPDLLATIQMLEQEVTNIRMRKSMAMVHISSGVSVLDNVGLAGQYRLVRLILLLFFTAACWSRGWAVYSCHVCFPDCYGPNGIHQSQP